MKIIKKIFMGSVILLVSLLITSCITNEKIETVKIQKLPQSVFEMINTTETTREISDLITVSVETENENYILTLGYKYDANAEEKETIFSNNENLKVTIENFSLLKAGSFVASVKFGNAVSYFDYQVNDSNSAFAGGDGSINNPYQVTTSSQLMLVGKKSSRNVYFKLMNDIDLSDIPFSNYSSFISKTFYGIFDGNNKKIYNLYAPTGGYLFKSINNATIKNLDLYFYSSESSLSESAANNIVIENVNIYGSLDCNITTTAADIANTAPFITQLFGVNLSLINCKNYVDINGDGTYNSAFVGRVANASNIEFINCENYGNLEGGRKSILVANVNANLTYTITNVKNYGNIITTTSNLKDYDIAQGDLTKVTKDGTEEIVHMPTSKLIKVTNEETTNRVYLNQNKQIIIKPYEKDLGITKVKVMISMVYMKQANGDTLRQSIYETYELTDTNEINTNFYAVDCITELDENGTNWLKYDSDRGCYIFNGYANDTALGGNKYPTAGTLYVTIYAYSGDELKLVTPETKLSALK